MELEKRHAREQGSGGNRGAHVNEMRFFVEGMPDQRYGQLQKGAAKQFCVIS